MTGGGFPRPWCGGSISLLECKASRTVKPAMAAPMQRLAEALKKKRPQGATVNLSLIYQSPTLPAEIRGAVGETLPAC